jgi:ribosomal protein S18 acetylase RimI-like enzyme
MAEMAETKFDVRLARDDDAAAIARLLRAVFVETYGHVIPYEALQRYLDGAFAEEAIATTGDHLLVHWEDGLAGVATLASHPPPTCVFDVNAIEIARFYIDNGHRGSGAADKLLAACEVHVVERGCNSLWLCAWEHNLRAIAFYTRHGFVHIGSMDIVVEGVVFHDFVMMKQLS